MDKFVKFVQGWVEIDVPQCQIYYVDHFNSVYHNGRDVSDFSTNIKIINYYPRMYILNAG